MNDTPLRAAICEDALADRELLLRQIADSGLAAACDAFASGEELLSAFAPGKYDLIFLDIYMGGMKGVDAAAKIREADRTVTLAFTTSSPDHALEGYRLKASAYLEKPVRPADVREVLEQALSKRRSAPAVKLLIEGTYRDIPLEDILYFEQNNHTVLVHTRTETLRASQTVKLSDIEALLPESFFRCHHSYIANLGCVRGVDRDLALFDMRGGDKVYIRRSTAAKAERAYEDYLFRRARGSGV